MPMRHSKIISLWLTIYITRSILFSCYLYYTGTGIVHDEHQLVAWAYSYITSNGYIVHAYHIIYALHDTRIQAQKAKQTVKQSYSVANLPSYTYHDKLVGLYTRQNARVSVGKSQTQAHIHRMEHNIKVNHKKTYQYLCRCPTTLSTCATWILEMSILYHSIQWHDFRTY